VSIAAASGRTPPPMAEVAALAGPALVTALAELSRPAARMVAQ